MAADFSLHIKVRYCGWVGGYGRLAEPPPPRRGGRGDETEEEEEEDAIIIDNLNYLSYTLLFFLYNYKTACARMIDDSNELKLRAVQH